MSDLDDLDQAVAAFAAAKIATTGLLTLDVAKHNAGSSLSSADLSGLVSNFDRMTTASNSVRAIMKKIKATPAPIPAPAPAPVPAPTTTPSIWKDLRIGAGGQLSNIDIAPDMTMAVRPDTYGAYIWDATAPNPGNNHVAVPLGRWRQMVSHASRPMVTAPYHGTRGSYETRIANSNTNILYDYSADGYVYRSPDKGATWTRTNFPNHPANANEDAKFLGYKMAVHPTNPDNVIAGTPNDGAFITFDAGATWAPVNIPASTAKANPNDTQNGGHIFAFVPGTKTVYAGSFGVGVFQSLDGGLSWKSIGGPTSPSKMLLDSLGNLYVTDGHLNKLSNGSWSLIGSGVIDIWAQGWGVGFVAINPTNPLQIITGDSGNWFYSQDGGTTWSNRLSGAAKRTADDIPWLANVIPFTVGNMVWATDCFIYFTDGVGVSKFAASSILSGGNWTKPPVTSISAGIEQLVANWGVCPPGKAPVLAFMDRPFFVSNDPNVYPSNYGPNYNWPDIKEGFSLDYASSDPNFIIGLTNENFNIYGNPFIAISKDAGASWTTVPHPPGIMSSDGCVAALTPTNWIWVEANAQAGTAYGGHIFYTKDAGANWNPVTIAGLGFDLGWYMQNAYNSLRRQMVIADRANGNGYMYNSGTVKPGFYRSTDGFANWTLACPGLTDTGGPSNYNFQMRAMPAYLGYKGGELYATSGTNDDDSIISNPFWKCVDNGDGSVTKTAVAGVINVWCFDFGAPNPSGSGVPAICIKGHVDAAHDVASIGGYGVWRSDDHGLSWTLISDVFVNGSLDQVVCIVGDSRTYNRFYVGFNGSGFAYVN